MTRPFDRRYAAGLLAILVSALALRLAGVHWGLPDAAHPEYSYHPDEMPVVLFARWLAIGKIIVNQFIFGGTLYFSVLNAYFHLANALGVQAPSAMAATIELGRYASVAYSLATIVLVAAIARRVHGRAAALVAALILAFAPAPLFLSHTLRPDELGMLLATCAVWLGVRMLDADERAMPRWHLATGALLGTLLAFRFPLAAFAIAPVVAGVLRARPADVRGVLRALFQRGHWVALAVAIPIYCGLSPHSLFYPDKLREGLQLTYIYQSTPLPDAIGKGPGWYQYGVLMLSQAFGWPIYVFVVAGVAWAVARRTDAQVLLLATVLPYLALASLATWVVVRYTLPTTPILALLAAIAVVDLAARARAVAVAAFCAALAWTLLADAAFLRVERGIDARDQAGEWLRVNLAPGTSVTRIQQYLGDFYNVPVVMSPLVQRDFVMPEPKSDEFALVEDPAARYLVVGDAVYRSGERLGQKHPDADIRRIMAVLAQPGPYEIVATFRAPIEVLGLDFSRWFDSQDFQLIRNEVRIYRRK